jgi:hypothetical protein
MDNSENYRFDDKENDDVRVSIALKRNETFNDPEKNILIDKQLTQNDENKDDNDVDSDKKQVDLDNPDTENVKTANEVAGKKKRKHKQSSAKRNARKKNKKAALAKAQTAVESKPEPDQTVAVFEFDNEDDQAVAVFEFDNEDDQGTSGIQQRLRNFERYVPRNRRERRSKNYMYAKLGLLLAIIYLERQGIPI